MSERLPVSGAPKASTLQDSKVATLLRAGIAAVALGAVAQTGCNDEHPELCSISATDHKGNRVDVTRDQYGNIVAVPCQCEIEDKPTDPQTYSVDDPAMPAACAAEVNAMIDREMGNATGGTGGSAGAPGSTPGTSGTGGSAGNPNACVPSTEVCDGYDNNCNGQIDEGGVCDSPIPKEGFKIYWITERPYDEADSAAYVPFGYDQLQKAQNGQLYSEPIKYLGDTYPGVSKGWATICLDDYCKGLVEMNSDGLRVGAAVQPESAVQIPLGYGGFTAEFGSNGPVGLFIVSDDSITLNVTGDGTQTAYSQNLTETVRPTSNGNELRASKTAEELDALKKAEKNQYIDMTSKE